MARGNAATAHPVNGNYAYEPENVAEVSEISPANDSFQEGFKFSSNKPFVIRSEWKVRAMTIAIWAMIFLAASGGTYAFFRATPGKTPKIPPAPDVSSPAGFAQMYVTQYLEATNDSAKSLAQFYPGATISANIPTQQFYVRDTSVVRIEPQDRAGYYAVTIAAQLYENISNDPNTPSWVSIPELRYYRVGVYQGVDDQGYTTWVATSLPSEVPEVKVAQTQPDPLVGTNAATDNQVTAITQFFNAYLIGNGNLLFVTTDNAHSHLRAFKTPPFQNGTIEVGDAYSQFTTTEAGKNKNEAIANVSVTATDSSKTQQVFNYSLLMKFDGKRWLIDDVLSAPPLAPSGK
jgi:hypothetical protein